jgi:hypothetical protein
VRGDGPSVFNQAPATAALRFNAQSGLKLANGTIPTSFTILARARYVRYAGQGCLFRVRNIARVITLTTVWASTTGEARRFFINGYDSDNYDDFALGWAYGVGQSRLGRVVANNGGDAVDRFHVAALRNTEASSSFLNGQSNSFRR